MPRQPPLAPLLVLVGLCFAAGIGNAFYNPGLYRLSPTLFWLTDAASFIVVPLAGVLLLHRRFGWPATALGFSALTAAALRHALLAGLALTAVFAAVLAAGDHWIPAPAPGWAGALPAPVQAALNSDFSYERLIPGAGLLRWVVVLYLSLSAGFMEELAYRALLFSACLRLPVAALRLPLYVVASAAAFALVHFEQGPSALATIFVLGLVAALLYIRLRAVVPFMIAHALVDLAEFA